MLTSNKSALVLAASMIQKLNMTRNPNGSFNRILADALFDNGQAIPKDIFYFAPSAGMIQVQMRALLSVASYPMEKADLVADLVTDSIKLLSRHLFTHSVPRREIYTSGVLETLLTDEDKAVFLTLLDRIATDTFNEETVDYSKFVVNDLGIVVTRPKLVGTLEGFRENNCMCVYGDSTNEE